MRRIVIIVLLLMLFRNSFGQVNLNDTEDHLLVFSIGAEKTFMNNTAFNNWTETNYNKKINDFAALSIDINIIRRWYDFGLYLGVGYPYEAASLYWGRRLTGLKSKISSYLNVKVGELVAFPDVALIDYTPTANQAGKQLQLRYYSAYIGLSEKNYLNKLSFRTGKGKKAVSYNSGFYVDFGYEPWARDWQYGYFKGSGKYAQFISNPVYGIPALNKVFFTTGIFIGIGN